MGRKQLSVRLLAHTLEAENTIAMAARLCYSGATIDDLLEKTQKQDQSKFIEKLAHMEHLSPMEHATFTFGIEGVSRALLAQITRHRIASFSVQSQRYVNQTKEGLNYVLPLSIEQLGEEAVAEYDAQMQQMQAWYEGWCEKIGADKREDARFVLPNASETRMVVTMNARELLHFFKLRCCERAQWEIRALAWTMLGQAIHLAPLLFSSAGASCVASGCSEGAMTCGKPKEIKRRAQELNEFVLAHDRQMDFDAKLVDWVYEHIFDENV